MKNIWIWVVILAIIVVGGYLGRHKIKSLIGASPAPVATAPTVTKPSPTSPVMSDIVMTKTDPAKGAYLTDPKGITLYSFDKDSKGVSTCIGACAVTWPPYEATGAASPTLPANITSVKRSDGSFMYAYKGMPLYFYKNDKKPGDTMGDGVGGVWHLVKP